MSRLSYAVSIALLASGSVAAMMVEQAKPAPTYESALSRSWEDVHNRVLAMAKDTVFPDSKLAWKPHPDSRSVMEELRHVTIGLEMTTAEAKGEKFDFEAREKADAGKPKTRASVVAEMEAAIAASYPLVKSKPRPQLLGWLEHQGEHYGKLVTAYRVNGVVPPVSRPKKYQAAAGVESLFLPQRFHRIDLGGSTRRDPRREQARDNNHQQAGEVCDRIGDVHDLGNHRADFGCEHESRQ